MSGVANKLMSAAAPAGPEGAWDLSYAYYDLPESLAWNISTASLVQTFSVSTQEATPEDIFFKSDGLKMYVLGDVGGDVNEYNLSTAWDVSTASFLQNFSVAAQDALPRGLFFKPDGTKMYVVGINSGGATFEYDLSTAWDVSTASFLQSFSVAAQESAPQGVFFKPDGRKMYVAGRTGDDINEYDLSTAWDVSTASFLQNFSVAAQDLNPECVFFKPNGTKMFFVSVSGDKVYEYDLSTAWDVSTASFLQSFSVAPQVASPTGIFFKPDGTAMYVLDDTGNDVNQYALGGFSVAAQENLPKSAFFKPDGTKMYIIGSGGDDVNEYDLSTDWDVSTASFLQLFSVAAQETNPFGLFFKPDGTKMYVVGIVGNDVNEYDLSTAWDVSSATFLQNFSVAAQAVPVGLFFKPDGTKMYVTGDAGQDVNEYNLSTAWDVSSASYLQNFSVVAQDTSPFGLFFKPDGRKMYVVGNTGDDINEYDLSTAWDISTASFLQLFSVSAQDTQPIGLFFKADGTQMFVIGGSTDSVYSYTLGVQE
jgi:DNA-binding beta-propeller fold protein YncE